MRKEEDGRKDPRFAYLVCLCGVRLAPEGGPVADLLALVVLVVELLHLVPEKLLVV